MKFEDKTKPGLTIRDGKHTGASGVFYALEKGGVLRGYETNPDARFLCCYIAQPIHAEFDDARFRVGYYDPAKEKILLLNMGYAGKAAAVAVADALARVFPQTYVFDMDKEKALVSREQNAEEYDRDYMEDNNLRRGQHSEQGSE